MANFLNRNVPPQSGPGNTATNKFGDSVTKNLPDKGSNFVETRLLILDHGTDDETASPVRTPEYVDFTEFGGIYRLKSPPALVNIGTEGVKPFRFKSSSLSLKLDNSDFAFDNLKKMNLKTVRGNPALFLKTTKGTNLDLQFRPAKLITKFPKEEMTVAYDLAHFRINGVTTDSKGTATIKLDSLEKEFIEKEASTVKDGRNWYFDRSVKFLAEELIKSVRTGYKDNNEVLLDKDSVSLAGIETGTGERAFSEFGRPIITVNPNNSTLEKGEKRLIVTAATPRCLFRTDLVQSVGAGSNIITMELSLTFTLKKDDVITIGKATGADFSDLNEEKVTVLEDINFAGTIAVPDKKNIKISSLKKDHVIGELVERWIIYLGCSNTVEDLNESYLITFDPDADRYGLIDPPNSFTDRYFQFPPRFLHLDQDILPKGRIVNGRLMMAISGNTFPGKPNEQGACFLWTINNSLAWDEPHLTLTKEEIANTSDGGVYVGNKSFRSLKPMLTSVDLGVTDSNIDTSSSFFGAYGVGKFVEDSIMNTTISRRLGFGYMAGLVSNAGKGLVQIDISVLASESKEWNVHPVFKGAELIFSGTIYLFGGPEDENGETFDTPLFTYSNKIIGAIKTANNVVSYVVADPLNATYAKSNTVAIIVPDSGKMYVRNLGENTLINQSSNVNVSEFHGNETTQETTALDTKLSVPKIYNDLIKHEKKPELDRAKIIVQTEKKKIDTSSLESGYYSTILEKKKLIVDRGDIIEEGVDVAESTGIMAVPGQYTAHPFAPELWKFYTPSSPIKDDGAGNFVLKTDAELDNAVKGDLPPIVNASITEPNGNSFSHLFMEDFMKDENGVLRNRNIHVFNYPIVGSWVKYEKQNKSLVSFDGTNILENGNSELLGYWYMTYTTNNADLYGGVAGETIPRISLAYSTKDGRVKLVDPLSEEIPDDVFPLCSVFHNVIKEGGTGRQFLDFYGNLDDDMLDRMKFVTGGSFAIANKFVDGSILNYEKIFVSSSNEIPYSFKSWDPGDTKFDKIFPLNMAGASPSIGDNTFIRYRFKRLKNPQAKGSLFTASHCYPVRPRHLHLPHNPSSFDLEKIITIDNDFDPDNTSLPSGSSYGYTAKGIDTNFSEGSEEILNQELDEKANIWVLDRFSQRKNVGLISGAGSSYLNSGILKGLDIRFAGDISPKKIEIPLGYRGDKPNSKNVLVKYTIDSSPIVVDNAFTDIGTVTFFRTSVPHGFIAGDIIKIDGSKVTPFPPPSVPEFTSADTMDGIYKVVSINLADEFSIETNKRINHSAYIPRNYVQINNDLFGGVVTARKYHGISSENVYLDDDVSIGYNGSTSGPLFTNPTEDLNTRGINLQLSIGNEYSYDSGQGRLSYFSSTSSDINFSWNGIGTSPDSLSVPNILTPIFSTGPNQISYTAVDKLSVLVDAPVFEKQYIDHKDHLPNVPNPSVAHPIEKSKQFLTYRKINFNTAPTIGALVNYPKAMPALSWNKFWKYPERRSIPEFQRIEPKNAMAVIAVNSKVDVSDEGSQRYNYAPTGSNDYNLHIRLDGGFSSGESIVQFINLTMPADSPWDTYINNLLEEINKENYFTAVIGKYKESSYNALFIYQRISGSKGNAGVTFNVNAIIKNASNEATIAVNSNGALLTDQISTGNVLFLRNTFLDGQPHSQANSNIYCNIISINNTANTFEVEGFRTYVAAFTLDPLDKRAFRDTLPNNGASNGLLTKDSFIELEVENVNFPDEKDIPYNFVETYAFENGVDGTNYHLGADQPYGEGSGLFDSGIKPTNFSDTFINSLGKWYLSRYDKDVSNITCDTYTLNHDKALLGNDDKLYAIINRHPLSNAQQRYPLMSFALGTERNFLPDENFNPHFYFARSKFRVVNRDLNIDGILSYFSESSGIAELHKAGATTPFPSRDSEIHGIFSGGFFTNANFGIMTWINEGNVNLTNLTTGGLPIAPENRFLSTNQLITYDGIGSYLAPLQWTNILGDIPINQTISFTSRFVVVGGDTYQAFFSEKPRFVFNDVTLLTEATEPLGFDEWISEFDGVEWSVKIKVAVVVDLKLVFGDPTVSDPDNFRTEFFDLGGIKGFLFLIKGWTQIPKSDPIFGFTAGTLRGIILKRDGFSSEDKALRDKREDLIIFHTEESGPALDAAFFEDKDGVMSPHPLTTIVDFTFRISGEDGYYFTDSNENLLKSWDGEITAPVVTIKGGGLPTVEGDFNQYENMVKLDNPYEEIFGFSMGTRGHIASQSFQGGRNIIWKLSKSLAFHIAVADFEGLNVWDALTQFAELSDSVVGFDRKGVFHFEARPEISEVSSFSFTFDNIEDKNIISLKKSPAYQNIYNEIQITPYKPIIPEPNVSLITQYDENIVTINHNTFIKDVSLDYKEKSPNKNRPTIKAFQKDFKRKKILLVCTNGQFSVENDVQKGQYSRFKYKIIEDLIELRLTQEAITGGSTIFVNKIPFDTVIDKPSIKIDDRVFIGELEFTITGFDIIAKTIDVSPSIPAETRFAIGLQFNIASSEQVANLFFAEGDGAFPDIDGITGEATGFTYSPKNFFTEIGEWTFTDSITRINEHALTSAIGPSSTEIPLDSVAGFPVNGTISIGGNVISYEGINNLSLIVSSPVPVDLAEGLRVNFMPIRPKTGNKTNSEYNPGFIRAGGYDELGPSCIDEYHLLDPNEDGTPYFDGDPDLGGKPITALEFFAVGQKEIAYEDLNTFPAGNPSGTSDMSNKRLSDDYRVRNRTFVNMKIDFNSFRFSEGDKIELDTQGIKLEPQVQNKQIFNNPSSINRNGLRQYPPTKNRFFNLSTASVFGKRNLQRISKIGAEIVVQGKIEDINELDWLKTIKIVDNKMFSGYENNQVVGYIKGFKFNQQTGIVDITVLTQEN